MEKIDGTIQHDCVSYKEFPEHVNEIVTMKGMIHRIREMTGFAFVIIRTAREVVQCVYSPDFSDYRMDEKVVEGCAVKLTGKIVKDETREGRYEMQIHNIEVLSTPAEMMPIVINKKQLDNIPLDLNLNMRPVTLRNPKERAVFKIQEGIARGFREFLFSQGFTEIRTPKINAQGAEGGANIFKLDYFGRRAYLAQSPQFYKQTMVGVYDRVFEVGPVFRAEKHATTRHLNEYTSLDFEMGFIDSFADVMQMETALLQSVFRLLAAEYAGELALLGIELPDASRIPALPFREAKERAAQRYGYRIRDPYDLEPEEEQKISQMVREDTGSDFAFITHYPAKKRPFYAMDDPQDARYTLSFDLLFRGMEVTTGGQRIHDYAQQVAKMERLGMEIAEFSDYLRAHRNGLPPHGGLGIGLERLTMKLAGAKNIREAALFPRDIHRLTP